MAAMLGLAACSGSATPDPNAIKNTFDIGGRSLYLECAGTGGTTVVMDSGLGDTHATWKAVVPGLEGHPTAHRVGGGNGQPVVESPIQFHLQTVVHGGVTHKVDCRIGGAPELLALMGGNLWLRADAPSCNADPTAVERRTIVLTGPGGEREEVVAVETGANTGIFVASALPVHNPPVAAGDGTLQGTAGTTFDVEVQGCSRRIQNVVTLMAPGSVVFW